MTEKKTRMKPVQHAAFVDLSNAVYAFGVLAVEPVMDKAARSECDAVDSQDLMRLAIERHPQAAMMLCAKAMEFISEMETDGNGLRSTGFDK